MWPNAQSHGRKEWPDFINTNSIHDRWLEWVCCRAINSTVMFLFCLAQLSKMCRVVKSCDCWPSFMSSHLMRQLATCHLIQQEHCCLLLVHVVNAEVAYPQLALIVGNAGSQTRTRKSLLKVDGNDLYIFSEVPILNLLQEITKQLSKSLVSC